ncbi:MAG: hypothetical protein ACT4QD_00355 [Acidobacteriota bacterium]
MPQGTAEDDLDWVAAQARCNAASMFERLRARVQEDVRRRNGLLGRGDGWQFEYDDDGEQFDVVRAVQGRVGSSVSAIVRFERVGSRINVSGQDVDVHFTAIVTVDGGGLCRFVVGEVMYAEWEIAKMALEQLFFEEADESE